MTDKILIQNIVCPNCRYPVTCIEKYLQCKNKKCNLKFNIKDDIPIMLESGGNLKMEKFGYYDKITGGTMEDNIDKRFVKYDTKIRTHYLKKYLRREEKKGLILDICCSKSPFYSFLKKWGYEDKVYGADLLFNQLLIAKKRGVKVVQANALRLPFPDSFFSKSIFTDAMVHLLKREDQQGVINEISRVLKKDGILLMTVTSLKSIFLQSAFKDVNLLDNTDHCTYYSFQDIKELTKKDFIIERFDCFAFYPYFRRINRNPNLYFFFDKLFNITRFKKYGMVYFFKLRKK